MSHKYLIFNANSRISVIGRWDTICLTFYSSQASDVRIPMGSLNQVYPIGEFNRLKKVHADYCTYQS